MSNRQRALMQRQYRCWEIHRDDASHDRYARYDHSLSWTAIWCGECDWLHQDIQAVAQVAAAKEAAP